MASQASAALAASVASSGNSSSTPARRVSSRVVLSRTLSSSAAAAPAATSAYNNPRGRQQQASTTTLAPPLADGSNSSRRRPGAYSVVTESQGDPNFFHLPVPTNAIPGETFEFAVSSVASNGLVTQRRLTVRCPPQARPGHDTLQLAVLQESKSIFRGPLKGAPLTSTAPISSMQQDHDGPQQANNNDVNGSVSMSQRALFGGATGGAVAMDPAVRQRNEETLEASAEALLATVPDKVKPGGRFVVRRKDGSKFLVTAPPEAQPGQTIRVVLSEVEGEDHNSRDLSRGDDDNEEGAVVPAKDRPIDNRRSSVRYKFFEVVAPKGVQPNQILPINVLGKRIPLKLPSNVVEGQTIKLKVPLDEVVDNIELGWDALLPGWNRTIRMSDLKFQWVKTESSQMHQHKARMTEALTTTTTARLDAVIKDLAFVRHLMFLEGNDSRMRTGIVELIPAQDAVAESELTVGGYTTLLSYASVAYFQTQPLEIKTEWFQQICDELTPPWEAGRIHVVVRRQHLLVDSVKAVMSLSRTEMRKKWRVEFSREPAIDAGGVMREWFQLITEQLFNSDFGLWLSSVNNQICMRINPACHVSCPEDHLIYFRFLGRIMGRALFDQQLVKGHMVRYLYKHLLGWPITFDDLSNQDEEYFQSLKELTTLDDVAISSLYLDFTIDEEILGQRQTVALVQRGHEVAVTKNNLPEYLEAILRYRMLERNKPQIRELLLGFFDVVPEPALTVFDPSELELLMCGLPTLDMDDWQSNTNFTGNLKEAENVHVVEWFWDVLRNDFDQEMKARFLQFATGTSGVPLGGFSVLQGNDGNIKLFTIHGVERQQYPYPRAHTCFNRIDLPNYGTKEELREKLKVAVTIAGVGFDIE